MNFWRQTSTDPRYLRRLFPNSVFTKRFTKARRKTVLDVLRRLTLAQRAVVSVLEFSR